LAILVVDQGGRAQLLLLFHDVVAFNEVFVLLASHSVEERMGQALDGTETLTHLHSKHPIHQAERFCAHFADISFLQSFRLIQFWKLEPDEARILIELLLQGLWQLP
jgi:hypothetical protein